MLGRLSTKRSWRYVWINAVWLNHRIAEGDVLQFGEYLLIVSTEKTARSIRPRTIGAG